MISFKTITACASILLCAASIGATEEEIYRGQVSQYAPVSYGTPETDPVVEPQSINTAYIQQLIFDYTNQERQRHGLRPLQPNQYLEAAAIGHSTDMANRGYFSHKSKGIIRRSSPGNRVAATGFQARGVAENIAKLPTFRNQYFRTVQTAQGPRTSVQTNGNTHTQIATSAVKMWMDSPSHRQNILNPNNTMLGVGVALGYEKSVPYVYLTQNFCVQ